MYGHTIPFKMLTLGIIAVGILIFTAVKAQSYKEITIPQQTTEQKITSIQKNIDFQFASIQLRLDKIENKLNQIQRTCK